MILVLAAALKTHRSRTLEMAGPAAVHQDAWVFRNGAGNPLDGHLIRRREFEPALRRAGIRKVRIHDLRHSFASYLIHQGESIKLVSTLLGHALAQITLDRYGHLLPGAVDGATERLAGP